MEKKKKAQPVKMPFYKTFVGSILSIIAILVAMYFIVISSLGFITGHGQEQQVPSLIGQNFDMAMQILNREGFEAVVDSTYDPTKPALQILDQQPRSGRLVKPGRNVFITVNKKNAPESPMPNLINLSLRSADLVLKSSKFKLGDTIVRPDFSKGAILEQLYKGERIPAGTMLPQGSRIDVVVGGEMVAGFVTVPNLRNIEFGVAKAILTASGIYYDVLYEGKITDTASAVIISQNPEHYDANSNPNKMAQGESMTLTIAQYNF